jgi:hypothetical protein
VLREVLPLVDGEPDDPEVDPLTDPLDGDADDPDVEDDEDPRLLPDELLL